MKKRTKRVKPKPKKVKVSGWRGKTETLTLNPDGSISLS